MSVASRTKNSVPTKLTMSSVKSKVNDDEFMAAAIGDVEWLKQSIRPSKQPSINFDKNGLGALHLASLHGRLDCVKLLIEKYKHDINLRSSTGWRPIHLSISNQTGKRSFAVLEYLLSKGADFSVSNDDGVTPMHQAASEGHLQCLKALIDKGAKIYVKDYRGHTPLDLAKLWGHRQCARVLATEQWHQEKDEVAKELKKLKKSRMIDELNDLNLLEDQEAGKQFYGADAYKDWLSTKGLQADESGKVIESESSHVSRESTMSGLYKPNSIAASRSLGQSPKQKSITPVQKQRTRDSFLDNTDYYTIYEKPEPPAAPVKNRLVMDKQKRAKIIAKKHFVDKDWNFSPQCKLLDNYQKDLQDCYPRDPITKLPHRDAAPKYLAGHKNVPISAFSKSDAYKDERRVVFQPENVLDCQTKVKYSEEQMMSKPQVFLNLSSDISSQLFQGQQPQERPAHSPGGLYIDPFKEEQSKRPSKTASIEKMITPAQSSSTASANVATTAVQSSPLPYFPTVGGVLPM